MTIYISGCNTFSTLDKIRKCGFDKDIINYIKNGVIYIGGSCGAHIVSKNIKHLEALDDNYLNIKDYDALGWFDGIIIPHFNEKEYIYQNFDNSKKDKNEIIQSPFCFICGIKVEDKEHNYLINPLQKLRLINELKKLGLILSRKKEGKSLIEEKSDCFVSMLKCLNIFSLLSPVSSLSFIKTKFFLS